MKSKDEKENGGQSGLFIGSEPLGREAEMRLKDKRDSDMTDGGRDKGDDDSSDKGDSDSTDKGDSDSTDKGDSDLTDKGDRGDDSRDADGKD